MKNIHTTIKEIITTLNREKQTISFAESCTGGRIVSAFTSVSGVSTILNGSCVTYSKDIKNHWKGESKSVIQEFGAVSEECVSQMLDGIAKMAKSDYAIAVSGIAGPTGGTKLKPVGTIYIGLLTPQDKKIYHCYFKGDREEIQEQTTTFAIEKLAKFLKI